MKKITNLLSMVLLMLCMGLTSCDDVLSVFDNPFGPLSISVKSIDLDADEMTLTVGDVGQLIATVGPENATDKTVTWTSSNESVATVDATGKVTAIAKGTAKIKAKAGSISTTCIVTVKAATVAVTSVTLDKTELALTVGDAAVQLTATVKPDNATDADVDWTSSDVSVATVDVSGLVTAVAEGIATITAKAGGKTAECTVTVAAKPLATPLTLEVLTDGTITVAKPRAGMYYKKNGGDQVALTAGVNATIDVTKGDKVEFYGTATHYCNDWDDFTAFGGTAEVKVYGNIMSLLSPTGFADNKELTAINTFALLFYGYANLKDASNLFLPAETLTDYCYLGMFQGCTSLTTAPKLPATTLKDQCYLGMFYNCTGLKDAYVKAAFDAAKCANMFSGCEATGAKLHTTSDHKASWDGVMGSTKTWSTWTAVDDWTD